MHYVQVKAVNADGGETPAELYDEGGAGYMSFTIDTSPPVISSIAITSITQHGATVSWTTDELSTGLVIYGKGAEGEVQYDLTSETSDTLDTEHSVTLTGMESNAEYHFKVKAIDDVGNERLSADQSFMTAKGFPVIIVVGAASGVLVIALVIGLLVRRRR